MRVNEFEPEIEVENEFEIEFEIEFEPEPEPEYEFEPRVRARVRGRVRVPPSMSLRPPTESITNVSRPRSTHTPSSPWACRDPLDG
ncbi:hypothetical protein DV096_15470 [Bradymonadaceae bacterium TMQ3]|nr:hypothetical protein DV096_15470 [Bradymonadaceae bacterium TMQ3]